jgi:phenylpropionate dioxygenase-like ring-hydroxylating dioxygenase large terminal subunit
MLLEKNRPLSPSQLECIYSLKDHDAAALPADRTTLAPRIYTDPQHFRLETECIFRREPLPVTVSALLPRPGMFVAQEAYGTPMLLTRGNDGEVRAFRNVCRHRGTLLCESNTPQRGGRVVCPYHAWTYGLEGQLIGVPRQETFKNFNKADHRLKELPCREAGGVIWIALQPGDADFSNATNAVTIDLDAIGLPGMHLYRRKIYPVAANWKLILDAFLENYHILRLHAESVAKYFVDSTNQYDVIGLHLRSTSGRANFSTSGASPNFEDIRRTTAFAYHLFPTAVFITSPTYASFMVVTPEAYNRSHVEVMMLTGEEPTTPEALDHYQRSFDLIERVFEKEDFHAAALGQKGLEADDGADPLVMGGLERGLRIYHDHIESRLAPHQRMTQSGS